MGKKYGIIGVHAAAINQTPSGTQQHRRDANIPIACHEF